MNIKDSTNKIFLIKLLESHPRFLKSNGGVNHNYIKTPDYVTSELRKLIYQYTSFLNSEIGISERVKYIYSDLLHQKQCIECGNKLSLLRSTYCSRICINNSEEVKIKRKESIFKRFGVNHAAQAPEIKEKTRQTNLSRFKGHHSRTKEFNIKQKQTKLKKYGNKNYNNRFKANQTTLDRYGVEYYNQKYISKEILSLLSDKAWLIDQHHNQKKSLIQISKEISVNDRTVNNYLKKHDIEVKYFNSSYPEKLLVEHIEETYRTKIITNTRKIIPPKEIDIWLPEYRLAIEFNGVYWHSPNRYDSKEEWFNYHQNKIDICKDKNIQLLHIWENYSDFKSLTNQAIKGKIENNLEEVYKILYS